MDPGGEQDSRTRVLDAARTVFASRGYRGGGLNEIARLAGISRSGLLHHFHTKEDLLVALLERRNSTLSRGRSGGGEPTSVFDLIDRLAEVIATRPLDRDLVLLAHILTAEAAGAEHPAREWVISRHRTLRARTEAAVRHSISLGEVDESVDPSAFASLVISMTEGTENQWLVDDSVDQAAVAALFARICREGLNRDL